MSVKSELDGIEKSLKSSSDEAKIDIKLNWRDDDLLEWPLEDGSSELITKDEFKKRGGVIVEWPDEEN
jgi:hypothetical protein